MSSELRELELKGIDGELNLMETTRGMVLKGHWRGDTRGGLDRQRVTRDMIWFVRRRDACWGWREAASEDACGDRLEHVEAGSEDGEVVRVGRSPLLQDIRVSRFELDEFLNNAEIDFELSVLELF